MKPTTCLACGMRFILADKLYEEYEMPLTIEGIVKLNAFIAEKEYFLALDKTCNNKSKE